MNKRVKTPKLICSLFDKNNYILHYRNLKLYLQLGMKLKRMHKVLEFDQSPWLNKYIDFNSDRRKEAKGEFAKSFYKLMNNALFGKTMENVRNRVDVHLIHKAANVTQTGSQAIVSTHWNLQLASGWCSDKAHKIEAEQADIYWNES